MPLVSEPKTCKDPPSSSDSSTHAKMPQTSYSLLHLH